METVPKASEIDSELVERFNRFFAAEIWTKGEKNTERTEGWQTGARDASVFILHELRELYDSLIESPLPNDMLWRQYHKKSKQLVTDVINLVQEKMGLNDPAAM